MNPNSPDDASSGLSGALAAALADVEALAEQKIKDAERDQIRDVVESVTGAGAAQIGPDIRGMPAEEAARRPSPADAGALRAMREQHDDLRRQLDDERAQTLRATRQLDEVRSDLKATRQRFKRMADQHDELQKRMARQELEVPARLRKQLLKNFLPALDSLDAVSSNLSADSSLSSEIQRGMAMVRASFDRALQLCEVVPFDALGQRFDPVVHAAISEEIADDVAPGTVLRQVGRGYLLGGKLLRSAQVVVARRS